jgi:hypothetical protein
MILVPLTRHKREPPPGYYNPKAHVSLVDWKYGGDACEEFDYQGPFYFYHGAPLSGYSDRYHTLANEKKAYEVINQLTQEKDIDIIILDSCNEYGGKTGKTAIRAIHAGSNVHTYFLDWLLKGKYEDNNWHLYAADWYLALPSGEEIELGKAIEMGLLDPQKEVERNQCSVPREIPKIDLNRIPPTTMPSFAPAVGLGLSFVATRLGGLNIHPAVWVILAIAALIYFWKQEKAFGAQYELERLRSSQVCSTQL